MIGAHASRVLKNAAVRLLALGGGFPVRATEADAVRAVLRSLHPRATGHGLVRFGPAGDGGYLVPDDLAGILACFSPGVGAITGFENRCASLGMAVFLADGSVDRPAGLHNSCVFTKKFVGATRGAEFMTMDDWVGDSVPSSSFDLLLQIDTEGAEYETFLSMSDSLLRRFRIIVAEFHQLDQLWNRPFFGLASRALARILQSHTCVHIHPNNCTMPLRKGGLTIPPIMEFTFLRNDRLGATSFSKRFPHALDADNTTGPHIALPDCWFHGE